MLFDKLSLFADGLVIPAAANDTTFSKVIDLRKNNLIDPVFRIYGQVVGAVNASGSVTTVVQASDDGFEWTDLVSFAQDGMHLIRAMFPITNKKRFLRLKFVVGATALGSAVAVKAGLVDQFDMGEEFLPKMQAFPPLEDLATDAFGVPLALAASAGSVTNGGDTTLVPVAGAVCGVASAPTGYKVTKAGNGVKIALSAKAADGNVVLVDGLGNKVVYSVTAATAG